MKNINEVLHKLAETRLSCPTFIIDELERLYYESDENGMATALLEADLLATKKELAEKDRTIAKLTKDNDVVLEQSMRELAAAEKNWREKGDENRRLRKALEDIADTKRDWSGVYCRVAARQALGE
ncbi:hypothetical protein [Paenibacillus sp. Mc5Re-14]|uniref:hypothetical protein n=1 Tax=Paenibacillus sp. Mc5Re-14 TaxID=1030529 RepID=UPI000AA23171|nr:hypothetical protein [Paenibacillus sp. Mc5Re-14]